MSSQNKRKNYRENERWLKERYLKLGSPYRVGEGKNYLTWLIRYTGLHPKQINLLQDDIADGKLDVSLRQTSDIELLLSSNSYRIGRALLRIVLFIQWHLIKLPIKLLKLLLRSVLKRIGLTNIRAKISVLSNQGWKYWPILGYLDIGGFLTEKQAVALYELARNISSDHPRIVEIGSWLGRSSFLLAIGIKNRSNPILYCIDPFDTKGDALYSDTLVQIAAKLPCSIQDQFTMNLKRKGVYHLVKVLVGYSSDFASKFSQKIDLLFIDGNHEYEAVLRDFEDWSTFIKPGGVIVLHDVDFDPVGNPTGDEDFVGPGLVAKEKIIQNPYWDEVTLVDNMLFAKRVEVD